MTDYNFSPDEIEMLNKYRDEQNDSRLKLRFTAMLLPAVGTNITLAASAVGKTVNTIDNWLHQYISEGIESLNSFSCKPEQSYLNFFRINQAVIYAAFENPENIKEIKEYIKEKSGIDYTVEAVGMILKKRGPEIIRPEVRPGNPPAVGQQQAFIKKYNGQKEADPPGPVRLFTDAMHLHHQNIPGQCRGDPKFIPVMDTDTGRVRLNISGAYNPETRSFHHLTGEENCNADRVIGFSEIIRRENSRTPEITMYSDNAKYCYAAEVKECPVDNHEIQFDFLPSYAPNLNLIERFWKYTEGQSVKNKYYKEYKTFRANVFQFLNNVGDHIEKLKTLTVENFQIVYA